jgi:hypothetical protein
MGGFANAVSTLFGSPVAMAKLLLQTWSPSHHTSRERWTKFQEHAIKALHTPGKRFMFVKSKESFHMGMDDTMPIVIQLRGKDGSETHAITIFGGNIYDSSSRYILKKSMETLQWCCGVYGYDRTLRTYILRIEEVKKGVSRKRRNRFY